MREIKFRGKVLFNGDHYFSGDWVIGFYVENEKGESFIVDSEPNEFGNASFQTVQIDLQTRGEYTGLKDKTRTKEFPEGKEIYEGDILESHKDVYYCTYNNSLFGFEIITKRAMHNCKPWFSSQLSERFEVIGNIHESK